MRERSSGTWELVVSAGLDPVTGRYRRVMDGLGRFDEWKATLTALANQLEDWQYRAKRAATHKDGDGG